MADTIDLGKVDEEGGPNGKQHHHHLQSTCNITKLNGYVKLLTDRLAYLLEEVYSKDIGKKMIWETLMKTYMKRADLMESNPLKTYMKRVDLMSNC